MNQTGKSKKESGAGARKKRQLEQLEKDAKSSNKKQFMNFFKSKESSSSRATEETADSPSSYVNAGFEDSEEVDDGQDVVEIPEGEQEGGQEGEQEGEQEGQGDKTELLDHAGQQVMLTGDVGLLRFDQYNNKRVIMSDELR